MTIAEIARELNISKPTAYELAASAGFPAIRIGERRIVVPTEAFKVWLEREAAHDIRA